MQVTQLSLNLWEELEEAAAAPADTNFDALWQQLEQAIAPLPQQLQLACAAEAILKIVQIYASRSDWLLSSWEQAHNPEGPVVAEEMLSGLVRQTMSLDLTALIESPEPEHRTRRTPSEPGSNVGTVDKAALLQVIEEIEAHSAETETVADPLMVAHSENIAQWATTIARWMEPKCDGEAVSLIQLQQVLGMPLVEVWLGLQKSGITRQVLLGVNYWDPPTTVLYQDLPCYTGKTSGLLLADQGQYSLEQRGDFYSLPGIWVRNREYEQLEPKNLHR
jgi:hypothetical protein